MSSPKARVRVVLLRNALGYEMAGEFAGKIVVVSGGSRGIGRGIALAFAREGAQTVIASSSAENLAAAAKAIAAVGAEPLTVVGDLRELAGCEQVLASVKERFGRCRSEERRVGKEGRAG